MRRCSQPVSVCKIRSERGRCPRIQCNPGTSIAISIHQLQASVKILVISSFRNGAPKDQLPQDVIPRAIKFWRSNRRDPRRKWFPCVRARRIEHWLTVISSERCNSNWTAIAWTQKIMKIWIICNSWSRMMLIIRVQYKHIFEQRLNMVYRL